MSHHNIYNNNEFIKRSAKKVYVMRLLLWCEHGNVIKIQKLNACTCTLYF